MTKEPYYWLNKDSRKFLERGYLLEGETPEQRFKDIAQTAEKYLKIKGFADKFEDYLSRGFYSISSPIISNFGRKRGLPISCFGSYVPDTLEGIMHKVAEVGVMTKHGGGTSAYFGDIRPRGAKISCGGESTGSVHFMELYNKLMNVVSQGNVRRGSFAAYLPIDHGDIEEFLEIRSEGHDIQEMSFAVTVSDQWMKDMIAGDKEKRRIWSKVIKKRFESGYPYIMFSDTVNKNAPQIYKDRGRIIYAQNLCAEICLSSADDESFVCDLSSLNLVRWDEIKNTDAVETLVYFLDAVMTEFIDKTEGMPFMEAPRKFAINQRALGVGVLGWHSLLQSKMLSFESFDAKMLNVEIWKTIRERADKATEELAELLGKAVIYEDTEYTRRNTTTLAVAPTVSSSQILGQVSPSIEPLNSNYYVRDLAKGKFSHKNPYLKQLLKEKGKDDDEIWASILAHGGSVLHLDFLSDYEKDVFKTFGEISQKEVVIQAAQRQKYIDQGQSLNLMIPHDAKPKDVNELLIFGWEQGVKSYYYQKSTSPAQKLARNILTCKSCEG
jgi:ribonucleoside-diphosphate reductase alpha chain